MKRFEDIDELIEKYFEGETSVAEEKELHRFFRHAVRKDRHLVTLCRGPYLIVIKLIICVVLRPPYNVGTPRVLAAAGVNAYFHVHTGLPG